MPPTQDPRAHASPRTRWLRVLDHHVLFPAMALLVLGIVWATTFNLIQIERDNAEAAAEQSARELLATYEAQMLRNLRELDQALKTVKYAYEYSGEPRVLLDLKSKGLLPPDLLFSIAITSVEGAVLASTRPGATKHLSQRDFSGVRTGELSISTPHRSANGSEWTLEFTRRVDARNGAVAGFVSIIVDAAYFVSGYERAKLGERGVLGLLGSDDGAFRVRRTGDTVASGDAMTHLWYERNPDVERLRAAWDGVVRFTAVRHLYGFPLTLVVGLAEDEALATARANAEVYAWRAAAASAALLLFIAILGRASWKLAQAARRESEAQLAHAERVHSLAFRDSLTGLPNRAYFSQMLEQAISQARRYAHPVALLFLDLDRFKQINDTLGHQAGDQLLAEIARRLKTCLRDSDVVARLGGDEFVVLLPEFEHEKYVATVAKKLLAVIAEPLPLDGQQVITTTSIGIAIYARDGEDEQTLMKNADAAMYQAKAEGKNTFQFFSQRLQINLLKRLMLETALRQALERGELELNYQARIDLRSERITGTEALLRWRSAEHGAVMPSDFIPIAEDTGLIVPIGRWVLETACAQNVAWQSEGLPPVCVSVNLSGRQFSDSSLLHDITNVLARTGMQPEHLELEVTESMLMHDVERGIRTLDALVGMGVRLAIDDFGTGYSSLSNLKRFPLHTLKIDRSFIGALPTDLEDTVITEAIIGMGKALRLTVIAEGVENHEQVQFLRQRGCDGYQGYHFSAPVPPGEFANLLRSQASVSDTLRTLRVTASRSHATTE